MEFILSVGSILIQISRSLNVSMYRIADDNFSILMVKILFRQLGEIGSGRYYNYHTLPFRSALDNFWGQDLS